MLEIGRPPVDPVQRHHRELPRQTDFGGDEVLFHAFSSGGTSLVEDADFVPALTAATVVAGSGAGPHDRAALARACSPASTPPWRPYIAELFEGFNGSAAPQDLETLFQLIYLYATRPRVDGRFYAQYETQLQRPRAAARSTSRRTVFSDALRIALSQGHFRARPVTPRLLEELDLERAVQVYADRFADFADFTFVFVGAFDWQVLRDLAETYLAALPVGARRRAVAATSASTRHRESRIARFAAARRARATSRLVFAGDMRWTRRRGRDVDRSRRGDGKATARPVAGARRTASPGSASAATHNLSPIPEYRVIVGFDSDRVARRPDARDAVLAEITRGCGGGSERRYLEEALGESQGEHCVRLAKSRASGTTGSGSTR